MSEPEKLSPGQITTGPKNYEMNYSAPPSLPASRQIPITLDTTRPGHALSTDNVRELRPVLQYLKDQQAQGEEQKLREHTYFTEGKAMTTEEIAGREDARRQAVEAPDPYSSTPQGSFLVDISQDPALFKQTGLSRATDPVTGTPIAADIQKALELSEKLNDESRKAIDWYRSLQFDTTAINARNARLREMAGKFPALPKRPALQRPSDAQLLAAGIGALIAPEYAFDILAIPFEYNVQMQEQQYRDALMEWEQKTVETQRLFSLEQQLVQESNALDIQNQAHFFSAAEVSVNLAMQLAAEGRQQLAGLMMTEISHKLQVSAIAQQEDSAMRLMYQKMALHEGFSKEARALFNRVGAEIWPDKWLPAPAFEDTPGYRAAEAQADMTEFERNFQEWARPYRENAVVAQDVSARINNYLLGLQALGEKMDLDNKPFEIAMQNSMMKLAFFQQKNQNIIQSITLNDLLYGSPEELRAKLDAKFAQEDERYNDLYSGLISGIEALDGKNGSGGTIRESEMRLAVIEDGFRKSGQELELEGAELDQYVAQQMRDSKEAGRLRDQIESDKASLETLRGELSGITTEYNQKISSRQAAYEEAENIRSSRAGLRFEQAGGTNLNLPRGLEDALNSVLQDESLPDFLRNLGGILKGTPPNTVEGGTPTQGSNAPWTWSRPVDSGKVSKGGDFNAPRDGGSRLHKGYDVPVRMADVRAARSGTVVKVDTQINPRTGRGAGKYITIDHGGGIQTRYFHLNDQHVSEGDKVNEGDIIGISGDSGSPGSWHLHFEVRQKVGDEWVYHDPVPILSGEKRIGPNSEMGAIGGGDPGGHDHDHGDGGHKVGGANLFVNMDRVMKTVRKDIKVPSEFSSKQDMMGAYLSYIAEESRKQGLDPKLFTALVAAESGWNYRAKSHVGAKGLSQIMDGTRPEAGITNPYDWRQAIKGGITYLAKQMKMVEKRFPNASKQDKINYALAAYNAGPGNVRKYGGIPPFRETRDYVKRINGYYGRF